MLLDIVSWQYICVGGLWTVWGINTTECQGGARADNTMCCNQTSAESLPLSLLVQIQTK